MSWFEILPATARIGFRLFGREHPWKIVVGGYFFSNTLRAVTYTLLGLVAAGSDGAKYSYIGASVLVCTYFTVSLVSDVPMTDKWQGTYPKLSTSGMNPFWLFLVRCLPHMVYGALCSLVAIVIGGVFTNQGDLIWRLLLAWPLIIPAVLSSAIAGLLVIAPAIGTKYDAITYNLFTALLTIFTGALVPSGAHGWMDDIGSILPLTHSIVAIRSALGGGPWLFEIVLELIVALFWGFLAWRLYALQDRRARRTGAGAFY